MPRHLPLLVALFTLIVSAQPASAASVSLVYEEPIPGLEPEPAYALSIEAAAGELNLVTVAQDADGYTVRDTGAAIEPGQGCEGVDSGEARCPTPRPAVTHSVFVDVGDQDDRATVSTPASTFVEIRSGAGADSIGGGLGGDLLLGGGGADSISGGDSHDRLDGGAGDDSLDGGTGRDRVLYRMRTVPVSVDLAAGSGGETGERDTYVAIEDIEGGKASDDLAGDGIDNLIFGGGGEGRDTVSGRGGNDTLRGYRVSGGSGDDSVAGRRVSCGSGYDLLNRAPGLWLRGPFSPACENALAIFVELMPDPVDRSRRAAEYAIDCVGARCRGTLELRDREGRLGIKRFSLSKRGDREDLHRVRVRLARRPESRVVELHLRGERAYQRDWFRTRLR
jgi:Ca2+-binding RTX toxin-like protein